MNVKAFSWNVRGLNNDDSQKQVMDLIRSSNLSFCGLLETRVKKNNLLKICSKVLGSWEWTSNASACMGRLVLGALVYFIWQECNLRLFHDKNRNVESLCCIIKEQVRLRIMSLKVKCSVHVLKAAEIWNVKVINGDNYSFFYENWLCVLHYPFEKFWCKVVRMVLLEYKGLKVRFEVLWFKFSSSVFGLIRLVGVYAIWVAKFNFLSGIIMLMGFYIMKLVYFLTWYDGLWELKYVGHVWSQFGFSFHKYLLFSRFEDLKANCILVGFLSESCSLFPYPGFVPMDFTREAFLRRQSHLAKCSIGYLIVKVQVLKMKFFSPALKLSLMVTSVDWMWKAIVIWMSDFISCYLVCNKSSYRRNLLLLVMFPKHVLGMSFDYAYMGLSI
ncbi:hypothetical protein CTI12_AA001400 [Artemisia annua]|uniref:RNA-directed DNA polymerase, eukaryota, Reverse transcriptase zinc-binding domain protein n=1 Tax=Artemisia annua TaxID=35608 RepID=A0A2U1QKZ2_ARTAN|nr:hypothetical protein CTI12_AA001400 [Artemisia annua]